METKKEKMTEKEKSELIEKTCKNILSVKQNYYKKAVKLRNELNRQTKKFEEEYTEIFKNKNINRKNITKILGFTLSDIKFSLSNKRFD